MTLKLLHSKFDVGDLPVLTFGNSVLKTGVIKLPLGKKSVKYKGSKLWNTLPLDVEDIKSLQTFKCVLRKYVLHSGI